MTNTSKMDDEIRERRNKWRVKTIEECSGIKQGKVKIYSTRKREEKGKLI